MFPFKVKNFIQVKKKNQIFAIVSIESLVRLYIQISLAAHKRTYSLNLHIAAKWNMSVHKSQKKRHKSVALT